MYLLYKSKKKSELKIEVGLDNTQDNFYVLILEFDIY